jgi:hypothetical protein
MSSAALDIIDFYFGILPLYRKLIIIVLTKEFNFAIKPLAGVMAMLV